MPSKGPLNYTTTIDPAKSATECVARLAGHGATAIGMTYDGKGFPTGLTFQITTSWGPRQFSLPVNVEGTRKALDKACRAGRIPPRYTGAEHAGRVAWRVLKDWLEAQLALIEAGVAELAQVMLPYLHVDGDKTLWQAYKEREQAALLPGSTDA
jgi:hypothetical protein